LKLYFNFFLIVDIWSDPRDRSKRSDYFELHYILITRSLLSRDQSGPRIQLHSWLIKQHLTVRVAIGRKHSR